MSNCIWKKEVTCPENCLSCTKKNKCDVCNDGFFLYNKKCTDNCPDGYLAVGSKCEKCNTKCKTCSISVDHCDSCKSIYALYQNTCISTCPTGTVKISNVCAECTSPCSSCRSKQDQCTACINGYYLFQNKCYSECPDGTGITGSQCKACITNCQKCSSSAETCEICKNGYYLFNNKCQSYCPSGLIKYNNQCISECPVGTTLIGSNCLNCTSNCQTCSSSVDHCDSCIDNYHLYNNQCVSECPVGTTLIGSNCLNCTSNCQTCSSSVDHCDSCVDNYHLYNNQCVSECPIGTTLVGSNCLNCTSNCQTCSSSVDHCDSCVDNYHLYNNQCVSECPIGTTLVGSNCLNCTSNCQTCSSSVDHCDSCVDNYHLYNNQCVSECPVGTTLVGSNCLNCTSNCQTCSSSVDHCESCVDNYHLYNNQCISECPVGTTLVGSNCLNCTSNCQTCSLSVDHCESCTNGYFLYSNKCYLQCTDLNNDKIYFGKNIDNQECKQCSDENCIDCSSNYLSCTKCSESHYYDEKTQKCIQMKEPTENLPIDPTTRPDDHNKICKENERCHLLGTGRSHLYANITESNFINLQYPENGGAIHFINYGIISENTHFINCSTFNGGGGIYIYLTVDLKEQILISKVTFNQCKAAYGGGIYAFSNLNENKIIVKDCDFSLNSIIESNSLRSNTNLFGGSAIFFTVKNSAILRCKFYKNYGGSSLKMYNDFNESLSNAMKLDENLVNPTVFISQCHFEIDSNSSCSFFYEQGKNHAVDVNLVDCVFIGDPAKGGYHIDGSSYQNNIGNSKLRIKSCKFSTDESKAVNMNSNDSFDAKSLIFNYKELANSKINRMKYIKGLAASLVFIAIIACITIFIKNKKSTVIDENNNSQLFEALDIIQPKVDTLI